MPLCSSVSHTIRAEPPYRPHESRLWCLAESPEDKACRGGSGSGHPWHRTQIGFGELRAIVLKTFGLVEPLRKALDPVSSRIQAAFVYGSVAKETDRSQSDIDLMIISDGLTYGEVFGVLEPVGHSLGRQINPTVYSSAEFTKRARDKTAFVTRVLEQPKMWVIGSAHDVAA